MMASVARIGLLIGTAAVVALGSAAVASGGHKGKDNDRRANKITVVERATTDTTAALRAIEIDTSVERLKKVYNQAFPRA